MICTTKVSVFPSKSELLHTIYCNRVSRFNHTCVVTNVLPGFTTKRYLTSESSAHTHTVLCSPCPIRDIGRDPASVAPVQGNHVHMHYSRSGPSIAVQLVMPLRSLLMRSHQRRACTSIAVFGDGWWALTRQPLKASLPKLFLHWHHPCSLQDVSVPSLVPQGDPRDVTKAMHLKRL